MIEGTDKLRALTRHCPVCQSTCGSMLGSLFFQVFDDSPISGDISLVACPDCGFVFYDTADTQVDYDRYYQKNAYYATAVTTGSGGESLQEKVRFEALCQRVEPYIPSFDANIIDVGCARGGLLKVFSQRGFTNLHGVDMVPECVRHVKDTLGVQAAIGSALELPFPEVKADLLIYSHVVEHVVNLAALVEAAQEKLKDEGFLYVEVPDASRYGEYTSNPYENFYLEHVNHFDQSTLANLFCSAGFQVVSSGKYDLDASRVGKVACVWAVFRKGTTRQEVHCVELERILSEYLDWSNRHALHKRLSELAQVKTPILVWGISQYAMLMLGQTALRDCNMRGFIDKDSSKRKRTIFGCSIGLLECFLNSKEECVVFVAALGYENEIVEELKAAFFRGKVLTPSGDILQL